MATFCDRPPFDDAAEQRARDLASKCKKPARKPGLLAIHAVVASTCEAFTTERECWDFYGSTRQRFYEWKKLLADAGVASERSRPQEPPVAVQHLSGLQEKMFVCAAGLDPAKCV